MLIMQKSPQLVYARIPYYQKSNQEYFLLDRMTPGQKRSSI